MPRVVYPIWTASLSAAPLETGGEFDGEDDLATTHRLPSSAFSNLEKSSSSWLTGCKVGQY
jgi:hypothetical protein